MLLPCGHYPGKPGWICLMHKTNLAKMIAKWKVNHVCRIYIFNRNLDYILVMLNDY